MSDTIGQPGDAFAMVGRCERDIAVDAIETDWLSPKEVLRPIEPATSPPRRRLTLPFRETEEVTSESGWNASRRILGDRQ
ncbi:hypothetical protein RESH_03977 [Rhodopirellula europaea SH398]|uniref:Uncharacterized protein n=1 Tax=Rhodopirellula europaea SH398 TaxID=1263868 RepID=M5SCS4_9BACT|nr:hypothetical protein RESH_03977 [Rhodopirellula europaea SH398]